MTEKKQTAIMKPAALLTKFQDTLQKYAVTDYEFGTWARTALLCIEDNDKLMDCLRTDNGQRSLVHALKYAAQTGLSLNPQEGKAALIAYSGTVQYQVMKSGLKELAMRSGKVAHITADVVFKNDDFDVEKTTEGDTYRFRPCLDDRGDVRGFYAAIKMISGEAHVAYMSLKEIEDHRNSYAANQNGPWKKSFIGMGIKTVLKKLLRLVDIGVEASVAVGADDSSEAEQSEIVTGSAVVLETIQDTDNQAGDDSPI